MSSHSADAPAIDAPGPSAGREGREAWAAPLLVLAALSCLVATVLVAVDVDSPVRAIAVLLLFTLAPGAAILGPRWAHPGLVIVTSLALDALAAQILLWLDAWDPVAATYVLAAVCFPVLVVRLLRVLAAEDGA